MFNSLKSTHLDNFFTVDKIPHSHFLIKSNHPITILANSISAHSALAAALEISGGKMTQRKNSKGKNKKSKLMKWLLTTQNLVTKF